MADEVILSREDMDKIRAEAAAAVKRELANRAVVEKKSAIEAAAERELQRMRREAGLTDHLDDILDITIDVAPYTDKLVIDGRMYFHGRTYQVPRRMYNSMLEMMARSWDHEDQTGYPNKKFYVRPSLTMNPMAHMAYNEQGGSFSYARDTRVSARTGATVGAAPAAA